MNIFYKYKTIIFIALFILLSGLIGFILYSLFFSSPQKQVTPSDTPISGGSLPDAQDGDGNIITPGDGGSLPYTEVTKPITIPEQKNITQGGLSKTTQLSKSPGANFTASENGKDIQYYDKYDGKFYKLDDEGNLTKLSDKIFYNVSDVSWSSSKDKAIIEYPDGANIVYDFTREKQITLPKHWEEFKFSPNDKEIVAKNIGLDPKNRWLSIANSDGSNIKNIEPLGNNADRVYSSWSPNNQSVAMFTEGIDLNRQSLYFVGKNQENFKSTVIEGRGFEPQWAPDGDRLLYSVYSSDNDLKPTLWIVNAQGEGIGSNRQNLGIETWANKCTFSGTKDLYCAVPYDLKKGAGLFPDLANSTNDVIYKIDTQTGASRRISVPDKVFTISNIIVSENEETIFFVDQETNIVHKIDI